MRADTDRLVSGRVGQSEVGRKRSSRQTSDNVIGTAGDSICGESRRPRDATASVVIVALLAKNQWRRSLGGS
jgi:hypothetical protein